MTSPVRHKAHLKFGHIHLTLTDVIIIKAALSLTLAALFIIPEPYHIPVGITANLVWIWRL